MELLILIVSLFVAFYHLLLFVVAYAFYHLGKRQERQAWNDLIEEGKIPRPRTRAGVPAQV